MPVALAPIGSIERFDAARLRGRRRRRRHVRLPDVPELGRQARHRGNRQGRAERPEDLPALRARRPGLGRGDLRPRGQGGLRRALPHRRHPSLQPPRARHLQALSRRLGARSGRLAPPEGARLGAGRQGQEEIQAADRHQGHRHRRGRQARGRARRRRDLRVEPRRPPARSRRRRDRRAAGDRRRGEGQGRDHHRRQLLPRHRRGEGDRARRRPGLRRPALCLRHGGGRPRRHLPRAGAAAGRDDPRHGTARRQHARRAQSVLSARRAAGAAAARAERVPLYRRAGRQVLRATPPFVIGLDREAAPRSGCVARRALPAARPGQTALRASSGQGHVALTCRAAPSRSPARR